MKILVTGAAGFIGTHLTRCLADGGHDVEGTDRRPHDLFGVPLRYVGDLLGDGAPSPKGQDHWARMPTSRYLDYLLGQERPDVVIHLAAQVGRQFGEDAPAVAALDNVGMTALVARSCAEAGVRLVYASTSEVYGDVGDRIARENPPGTFAFDDADPDREARKRAFFETANVADATLYDDLPHNVYGLTKRQAEEVAALYTTWHGANYPDERREIVPEGVLVPRRAGLQVIRPSMPYGPGLPAGRGRAAIVNFLWQAHHGAPLTVHRGAERSWCWIGDAVAGIRAVIEDGEVAYVHDDWRYGVGCYNVGRDDAGVPMQDVALKACDIAGVPGGDWLELVRVVDAPGRQTIVKRLSTAKLRGLGWQPLVDLEEGMRRTYDWLVEHDWQGAGAPPP